MTSQGYFFEIRDLLTQFVAAFDNVVIKRYNKNRELQNKIQVRYVYSPKERVMFDLVNKAQNITIPVVAVSIGSISRSNDRVFNKVPGFYFQRRSTDAESYSTTTSYMRSPVPIDIAVNMSILTKYQSDMDQILSNFVPYNNPYIILSWKIPTDFNLTNLYEIRSEVLWNGSISMSYPMDITATAKYRVTGDTSFIIKGWLFPAAPTEETKNIFQIDANFYNSSGVTLESTYESLSGQTFTYPISTGLLDDVETVSLTGLVLSGFAANTYIAQSVFRPNQLLLTKYPFGIQDTEFLTTVDHASVITFNPLLSSNFYSTTLNTVTAHIK